MKTDVEDKRMTENSKHQNTIHTESFTLLEDTEPKCK